jgi:hypothetical protein
MKIQYDEDRLTVNDLEALTESPKPKDFKRVLGKFVLGDDGDYMTHEAGMAAIGELTLKQLKDAAQQFAETAQAAADPK